MSEPIDRSDGRRSVFENSPISRRQFVRLSAATAGALALPGQATAEFSSSKLTDEYQYTINHLEEREEVPTLITFSDEAGLEEIGDLNENLPFDVQTTTNPAVAAHAYLTADQVEDVLDIESVTELQFSPGSNPFWLLEYYPQDVFPDPEDSVDYIDYEQLQYGMEHLTEQHPDRLRFQSIGRSPGHYNFYTGEEDPKNVWIAEVTNDIDDDTSFEEKQKLVFSLSIHADERGGVEAGTRFAEDVLTGEESTVEDLLDEVVLIFVYTNPDGWVARYTQYNDGGEGYERYTAGTTRFSNEPIDPNRNYPTIGWIDGTHYPAEPNGLNLENDSPGIDEDVGASYTDNVIDALSVVEYLRDYDNLAYGLDLHGMYTSDYLIEGATVNKQYSYEELTNIHEYASTVDDRLEENVALDEYDDLFEGLQTEEFFGEDATIPTETFTHGTNNDVLDYGVTGYLSSWMGDSREQGGLGMNVMLPEMVFNNQPTPTTFAVPEEFDVRELVELWVTGYTTMTRTLVEHAAESVRSTIVTNDRSTAVVTTDSLTRSSDQLDFVEQDELEVSSTGDGILTGKVVEDNEDWAVETPDPEEILEYEQRAYEVTPFEFFEDVRDDVTGDEEQFVEITIDNVCDGTLLSEGGQLAYDNLIVIHDEGDDSQAYTDAIDEYVEAGGNLVLTDAGINLLPSLVDGISGDDIATTYVDFPNLASDDYPNYLLTDTRPYQDQLWRNSPLGYGVPRRGSEGEVPMELLDPGAFADVGGEIASETDEMVALGLIPSDVDTDTQTGITLISTLLPPVSQVHLHPFGMANHAVSFFGVLILTNALGYSHYWYVDDELVRKIGAPESD